jgi:hypothetical protein
MFFINTYFQIIMKSIQYLFPDREKFPVFYSLTLNFRNKHKDTLTGYIPKYFSHVIYGSHIFICGIDSRCLIS